MQRRLRFIFVLLASCLLGIYGFQAYWLYGSYQVARAQFAGSTRAALEAVVQQVQLRRTTRTFNIKFNNYDGPRDAPGTTHRWQIERLDTGLTSQSPAPGLPPAPGATRPPQVLVFRSRPGSPVPRPGAAASPAVAELLARARRERARSARTDSLAARLSTFVVNGWYRRQPADLPALSRAYRAELARRQVALPFVLDTLPDSGPGALRVQAPGTGGYVGLRVARGRAGYPVATAPVALNPVSGPAVVAYFQSPTTYLLGRLAGSLAGSVLLLALTTTCFWLMLSTILRQKKLSEVKTDFINNMTHELKTPLATVSAAVEALQDFGALRDPARTDRYLTIARQETRRLADLVEKVLHAAAAERTGATLDLHPELLHPAELVAGLVSRHQLQAPKPVRFEVDIDAADTVRFDPLHLAGVLHNLLDNAIKYSAGTVTIAIRGRAAGGGWQLQVSDDGPGIPRSYQASIFEQFFRVPTGNLHPVKGFGLGLYYVRQVMERHGGHVSVRSDPGRGSAFTLWLPG